MKTVAILIPVFNHLEYTKQCISNLDKYVHDTDQVKYEVIIIDDGSTDGTKQWLEELDNPPSIVEGDGTLWWSGGINTGAKYAIENLKSDYVLLWNNDIECEKNYFSYLSNLILELKPYDIIGSLILYKDEFDKVWSNGGFMIHSLGARGFIDKGRTVGKIKAKKRTVDWITGMGTLIPVNCIEKIGYWDNNQFPQYYGDLEYTYRAKKAGFNLEVHKGLIIWNDTSNSRTNFQESVKDFLKSFLNFSSNRSLALEIALMRKFKMYPFGFIGIIQRVVFSVFKFTITKIKNVIK